MAGIHTATMVCSDIRPNNYILCISREGDVYSWGKHTCGAHGHEECFVFSQKRISSLKNIIGIACGSYHSICLDGDGNVFTFGSNSEGQLGIGSSSTISELFSKIMSLRKKPEYTSIPQKVDLPPIQQIACGGNFNICLSINGELFSFGQNNHGQLGLGNTKKYFSYPQKIEKLLTYHIEFVECAYYTVLCKSKNNEIFGWGDNNHGQLGIGTLNDKIKEPVLLNWSVDDNIVDIALGYAHTLVLTSSNEVFTCGWNRTGQLGRTEDLENFMQIEELGKIEELSDIIHIECGYSNSRCIDVNYNLFVFGSNEYGQLGLGDTDNRYQPVKHPSLSNIIDISKGGQYTFVKTSNNEIYAFGYNDNSQLGIKTENEKQLTPIRVFEDNEDIWCSNINKSKAKSARF